MIMASWPYDATDNCPDTSTPSTGFSYRNYSGTVYYVETETHSGTVVVVKVVDKHGKYRKFEKSNKKDVPQRVPQRKLLYNLYRKVRNARQTKHYDKNLCTL